MNSKRWALLVGGVLVTLGIAGTSLWLGAWIYMLTKKQFLADVDFGTFTHLWDQVGHIARERKTLTGSYAAAFVGQVAGVGGLVWGAMKKPRELHGSARFANGQEINKAFPKGERGIILGKAQGRYLEFGGQQFVMLAAPTRSGKGVGVVVPNLLSWPESVVVLDVKQENWDLTSGFRHYVGQQDCFLFNPVASDKRTHCWNPLDYVKTDKVFRADSLGVIASLLFPDTPGTDPIWTATPRALFSGIAMMLLDIREVEQFENPELAQSKPFTLGQIMRETLQDGDGATYFKGIIDAYAARKYTARTAGREGQSMALSPETVRALNTYISVSSDNTRAGVMTSFRSRLELWLNPLVDAATSRSDFRFEDFRRKPMSLYVGVAPGDLERLEPLLNLFFKQFFSVNTQDLPQKDATLKYKVLLVLDEFTALGKIPIFTKAVGFIAGYNLRCMPIIQSISQLRSVYGEDDARTLITNHAVQIVFPPREQRDAKDYSEALGYTTEKGVSKGRSNAPGKAGASRSENVSDQRRALMLPQELKEMPQTDCIVFAENTKPVRAKKITYYDDKTFVDRLRAASAAKARTLGLDPAKTVLAQVKAIPTQSDLHAAVRGDELALSVEPLNVELMSIVAQGGIATMTAQHVSNAGGQLVDSIVGADSAAVRSAIEQVSNGKTEDDLMQGVVNLVSAMGFSIDL
jgi:type IV secretion system protein VirD4